MTQWDNSGKVFGVVHRRRHAVHICDAALKKIEALKAVCTEIKYKTDVFRQARALIHSYNAKKTVSAKVHKAARQTGTQTSKKIPNNLEEKGIAERVNRTLLSGTRCLLSTEGMPLAYCPYAIREASFKQVIIVHEATGAITHVKWHDTPVYLPRLPAFGQIGYVPKLPIHGKLEKRGLLARNMGMFYLKHLVVPLGGSPLDMITSMHFSSLCERRAIRSQTWKVVSLPRTKRRAPCF